jgi:hypothetical protein
MADADIELSLNAKTGGTAVVHTEAEELDVDGIPVVHEGSIEPDMNPYMAHGTDDDEEASVGGKSMDDFILPIADMEGNPVHYPGEEDEESWCGDDEVRNSFGSDARQ